MSCCIALCVAAGVAAEDTLSSKIAVVVGEKSVVGRVTLDELRELYLRRTRRWPGGVLAVPINLPPDHPLRDRFSRLVLGRATADLVSYWDARYFEGTTPPAVLPSPAAVRAYLAVEPAAIAYVPIEEAHEPCRVLLVLDR